jgi:hypothetical protein
MIYVVTFEERGSDSISTETYDHYSEALARFNEHRENEDTKGSTFLRGTNEGAFDSILGMYFPLQPLDYLKEENEAS